MRMSKTLDEIHANLVVSVYQAMQEGSDDTEARDRAYVEAKQAITSLIKELVAEAKPAKEIGAPVGEYETGGECSAYADGSNEAAEQFEQNLLKALEEV